ncbi:MAG: hypothetical protein JJ863_11495 [Deltaproteobacteria bacterium]|nr:hypothetical protein [Deltaproteobacteria bacterium]
MKRQPPATARGVATAVLHRVARDAAWATPTLDAEIRRAGLDRRDASLATAIVYGTLRSQRSLDALLDGYLRDPERLDGWTRAALRSAAFQLRHLQRIPPRAAVHEAVDVVRAMRGEKLARLANAVLRKIRRPDDAAPPTSVEVPEWIEEALVDSLGPDRARALTKPLELPPPIDLRVRDVGDPPLIERLAEARPDATIRAVGERSLRLTNAGDPRTLPGFEEGAFIVQELGSQLAADALGAQPGERIADTCAGRGGKTLALLDQVGADGSVVALELHEARLDQLEARYERLGEPGGSLEVLPVDLRVGVGGLAADFDRVLVDAPCTGLGTLGRRPELTWRLTPGDIDSVTETQRGILEHAATLVRPGGLLQLVVCSPLRAEGPAIGEAFEAATPGFERDPAPGADDDGVLRLGPWTTGDDDHPTDAYQILRWRRR